MRLRSGCFAFALAVAAAMADFPARAQEAPFESGYDTDQDQSPPNPDGAPPEYAPSPDALSVPLPDAPAWRVSPSSPGVTEMPADPPAIAMPAAPGPRPAPLADVPPPLPSSPPAPAQAPPRDPYYDDDVSQPPPDESQDESAADVSLESFQSSLSQYGEWVIVEGLGEVWKPYEMVVGSDFRPYGTRGYWQCTDAGWAWVSDWNWGWAPFHYGRWWIDANYGWVWLPGTVWAPAWVSWRYGNGYAGWIPLAPRGFSWRPEQRRVTWSFVEAQSLVTHSIHGAILPPNRVDPALAATTAVPATGRGWSRGPSPRTVGRDAGQAVRPIRIRTSGAFPPESVVSFEQNHRTGGAPRIGNASDGFGIGGAPPESAAPGRFRTRPTGSSHATPSRADEQTLSPRGARDDSDSGIPSFSRSSIRLSAPSMPDPSPGSRAYAAPAVRSSWRGGAAPVPTARAAPEGTEPAPAGRGRAAARGEVRHR